MNIATHWPFQEAPTLLAVLDEELVCRHTSRGWRERLELAATTNALALPLTGLFTLDDQSELPEQLEALLHNDAPLHDVPVSLTGKTGITQGLLSAWCLQQQDGRRWLYLAPTCDDVGRLRRRRLRVQNEDERVPVVLSSPPARKK